jgi:hypothetical protein
MPKSQKAKVRKLRGPRGRGAFGFTVPEAEVGLSKNGSYDAAKRGDIPTVRIGSQLIVPKAAWLRKLGIEDSGAAA